MRDEIVSRLANALNAQLTEEEARRSQLSPHPDSMDLFFQGKASLAKGWTPEHSAQARDLFVRALALDPKNIEAMVGLAGVDTIVGGAYFTRRPGRASRGSRGDGAKGIVPSAEPCRCPLCVGGLAN